MTNILQPLEPPYSEAISTTLSQYPTQNGYLLSLFRTFANSERFLKKCIPNLLDNESPLSLRTREIIILRVTANKHCEYEWGVHVAVFSKAAQLSEKQITATLNDDETCWSVEEQRLLAVVDQVCETATLEENILKQFQKDWTQEEQLEIIALIGTYSTISSVANIAQLSPEKFAARFPK